MNDNFAIDQLIEEIASSGKIKSFYPISISKKLNLPISVVLNRLNYLVDGSLLSLKYEIRCTEHLTELELVDSYDKVLGTYINCYECNEDILIGLENIFIVYYLNNDYIESIKKKRSIAVKNLHSKKEYPNIDSTPQDMISIIKGVIGENENNNFPNIKSIDYNVAKIAEVLSNSGEKDISNNFKEIDEEIKESKKRNIGQKIISKSETIGKLKDGAEGIEKFYPHIVSTINMATSTWPAIQPHLNNFLSYINPFS
ncbi:hypothetical protein DIC82_14825 [Clostridium beijerinckii]|nr:hypothetical protein DIC82_14825 [Clostridium beijerinckii]